MAFGLRIGLLEDVGPKIVSLFPISVCSFNLVFAQNGGGAAAKTRLQASFHVTVCYVSYQKDAVNRH